MSEWDVRPGETPIDLSGLVDRSIASTRAELYDAEAANILKAFLKYGAGKPIGGRNAFKFAWMLDVHNAMYRDVWQWAGVIRQKELNLGVNWWNVGQAISDLERDIHAWGKTDSPQLILERAVRIHHRAVHIHPFENGNGRWARFMANIYLRRSGKPEIDWPEQHFSLGNEDVRDEYIAAIKRADDHDIRPLIELHARFWPQQ